MTLKEIRDALAAQGREAWSRIEAAVVATAPREHMPGATLVFHGIDPTRQRPHPVGRAVVWEKRDERFVVPLDTLLSHRVAALREAQLLVGFPVGREQNWYAVGEIAATHQEDDGREHDVRLHAIHVPDQLTLGAEDVIVGLDQALAALDVLQATARVPADHTPNDLVKILSGLLATHHWRAFARWCDDAMSATDRRMAFEQMTHAFGAANGSLSCTEVVGDAATGVRTKVERPGPGGEPLVRTLRWVHRGDGWRYAGGLL